jgi:hypothetical protein
LVIGRIHAILIQEENLSQSYIVLEHYQLQQARHERYQMPLLSYRFGEKRSLILSPKVSEAIFVSAVLGYVTSVALPIQAVSFSFNVQHDCVHMGCTDSGRGHQTQERLQTTIETRHLEHTHAPLDRDRYIINLHSLHNPHLVRQVLPRRLVEPIPLLAPTEREQRHRAYAEQFATKLSRRKTDTATKRAQTLAALKAAAAAEDGQLAGQELAHGATASATAAAAGVEGEENTRSE